ncbi:DNA-damage-repair/toleration protein DRT111, chloroplastic-like [Balamuthia mandrillaris]
MSAATLTSIAHKATSKQAKIVIAEEDLELDSSSSSSEEDSDYDDYLDPTWVRDKNEERDRLAWQEKKKKEAEMRKEAEERRKKEQEQAEQEKARRIAAYQENQEKLEKQRQKEHVKKVLDEAMAKGVPPGSPASLKRAPSSPKREGNKPLSILSLLHKNGEKSDEDNRGKKGKTKGKKKSASVDDVQLPPKKIMPGMVQLPPYPKGGSLSLHNNKKNSLGPASTRRLARSQSMWYPQTPAAVFPSPPLSPTADCESKQRRGSVTVAVAPPGGRMFLAPPIPTTNGGGRSAPATPMLDLEGIHVRKCSSSFRLRGRSSSSPSPAGSPVGTPSPPSSFMSNNSRSQRGGRTGSASDALGPEEEEPMSPPSRLSPHEWQKGESPKEAYLGARKASS